MSESLVGKWPAEYRRPPRVPYSPTYPTCQLNVSTDITRPSTCTPECLTRRAAGSLSSPRPLSAHTSLWNVCTCFASPTVLVPNDCLGVQALSAARHGTTAIGSASTIGRPEQTSVSTSRDPLAAGSSTSIPWTITNKYYTADVHFETHEFEQFRVHHAVGVPAIIYVWGPGEVRLFQTSYLPRAYGLLVSVRVALQRTHPGDSAEGAGLRS